jgi:hypothetical protein
VLFASELAVASPVSPVVPCDRPVQVFGGSSALLTGVRVPGSNDLSSRIKVFFERSCGGTMAFETVVYSDGGLLENVDDVAMRLAQGPRSVALLHFPVADIEAGATVDAVLQAYRKVVEVCASHGSVCIIGGQQPVNALGQQATERQLELERRASAEFGPAYLPLYAFMQSELPKRRLMLPIDSGDGRHVDDFGHELLFALYRRRLLERQATRR